MNRILTVFLTILGCKLAFAQERYEFYNGVRALGMGGASVATVNDETALILNPAALGRLRNAYLTIVDPEADAGSRTVKILSTQPSRLMDVQELREELVENKGEHLHARAQLFPSFVTTNFGLGFLANYRVDGQVNPEGTIFRLDYRNDFAVITGLNLRLFGGIIKFGANARLINRDEVSEDLDANSSTYTLDTLRAQGMGLGTDLGLMLTLPVQYLPTLAAVWRDVGNTSFGLSKGNYHDTEKKDPQTVVQTVDVGLSISPILGRYFRFAFTGEFQDVLTASEENVDIMRRIHAGMEFNLADTVYLRAGLNQRYWTAGLEYAFSVYQVQLASYGEEIGTPATPKEDRRYVAKWALRF